MSAKKSRMDSPATDAQAQRAPNTDKRSVRLSPWDVARRLRERREELNWSQRQLEAATRDPEYDPTRKGVSAAHIGRIERREAEPSLSELYVMTRALGIEARDLLFEDSWFVVRKEAYEQMLAAIRTGDRVNEQTREAHQLFLDEKRYRYAPLRDDLSEASLKHGVWAPIMQAHVFEMDYSSDDDLARGLDAHDGEELIIVLSGSLDLLIEDGTRKRTRITLHEGDSVHYTSRISHAYRASRPDVRAEALFVYVWRGEQAHERINWRSRGIRATRRVAKTNKREG